ncbi:hypothetical protein [Fulvimonas yonginensis]|uniref:Uncharacterized protein n=1 Tax=Fulvimonas yonginensis TaxID=1495200 RepID=A0ABU8JC83_9GAMM
MKRSCSTVVAGALAFVLACGGALAQSSGGNGGTAGGSQAGGSGTNAGTAGHRGMNGANASGNMGTMGNGAGGTGPGGGNGANDCANQAGVATANRVNPENAPPGTPVRGAANHGSTDWSSTNCVRPPKGNGQQPMAPNPDRNGGGLIPR